MTQVEDEMLDAMAKQAAWEVLERWREEHLPEPARSMLRTMMDSLFKSSLTKVKSELARFEAEES